jgi:predicted amidohydrolase YtcJ
MNRMLITADSIREADTLNDNDSVLVEASQIVAIGEAADLRGPGVPEIGFEGATIVPGLRDAHLHPVGYAAALQRPSLKTAPDFQAIGDILAEALQAQPHHGAITALRLDDENLAEQRLPDRSLLDSISASRPILLMRYCGHVAVANTAALTLAGIDRNTPDPPGGVIDRDDNGDPTGVLRETAFEPVTAALRPLAAPLTSDDISTALTALAATGLTSVGAMAAPDTGLWGGASSELEALLEAAATSPIRLGVYVIAPTPETLEGAAELIERSQGSARFLGVKMFSDGSLGGHTAAMHSGFADLPEATGTDRLDPAWSTSMAEASLAMGGGVAIHAIGDRANGSVLDLMETLIGEGADPARLRIEHASVLTVGDVDRFGRLGVTASVQPAFIASETEWLEKRLGTERAELTYAFRSLADAGAPLAGGSDSPVEPPHPLLGMAAARDRLGFVPAESLSAIEAFRLFTDGAAAAIGEKAELAVGAPADFTVLDVDPIAATPEELRGANVVSTWVDGVEVQVPNGITTWQG